jgi:hypothetical protein
LSELTRPVPVPDETSEGFWAASAAHVLALARCSRCGELNHPPDSVCFHCGSTDPEFAFSPVDGTGKICSWTVMRQSFLPGFDVPFVLVDVALLAEEELRLIGRLMDGPETPLRIGAPVRMVFEDIAPGIAVPAFELAGDE